MVGVILCRDGNSPVRARHRGRGTLGMDGFAVNGYAGQQCAGLLYGEVNGSAPGGTPDAQAYGAYFSNHFTAARVLALSV
jgi:hypothetical protein